MIRFYVDFLQAEGRCQEEEEEELHHPQEDQAQAQEGQAGRPQVLQGKKLTPLLAFGVYLNFEQM